MTKKNCKNYLIIDCETYIYKAMTACKVLQQCETDRYIFAEHYNLRLGLIYFKEQVERLLKELNAQDYVVVIGDKENFRKKMYPSYKAHREAKPDIYYRLLDCLAEHYDLVSLPNLEADDTCRIIYEDKEYKKGFEKIIVSVDKDFYSVPCLFYRDLPSNKDGIKLITKEDADRHLYYQIINGDSADGYKGIPGYGDKKTNKFLEANQSSADVLQLFRDNGLTGEDYVKNKVLASIVSYEQYNFKTGEVNLSKG